MVERKRRFDKQRALERKVIIKEFGVPETVVGDNDHFHVESNAPEEDSPFHRIFNLASEESQAHPGSINEAGEIPEEAYNSLRRIVPLGRCEMTLELASELSRRTNMRVLIEQASVFSNNMFDMHMMMRERDSNRIHVVRSVTMETIDQSPNEVIPHYEAALRLPIESVQEIMNKLWIIGLRPAERLNQTTQEVAILREEVTYLRTLVQRLTNCPELPSSSS